MLKWGHKKSTRRNSDEKFRDPQQRKVLKDIIGNSLAPLKHWIDVRNRRNIEKLIVSIWIKGSLRLKDLSQVFSLTEGGPVKRYLNHYHLLFSYCLQGYFYLRLGKYRLSIFLICGPLFLVYSILMYCPIFGIHFTLK